MKKTWLWAILPLIALLASIGIFLSTDPLSPLGVSAPPLENLTVERTVLSDRGISLLVRAEGSEPMQIAQVQVDGSYWTFTQKPPGAIPRLSTVWLDIPYPWVENETHHLNFVTSTGISFEHTIDVAVATPQFSFSRLWGFTLLGLYVGVVPVGLGMLFYPSLKTLGGEGMKFILALTLGMLAFLLVDTIEEGLELARGAANAFSGSILVWAIAAISFLTILTLGRSRGKAPEGQSLSIYLSFSIGIHNLGEGLAIGTAFAVGEAALGSLLVVGFTLHNLTEGIGIAAPLVKSKPSLITFVGLTALAGLPAVLGTWIGVFAFSPHWGAIFMGIGAGAILQVIVEVGSYLARTASKIGDTWLSKVSLAGFSAGLIIMYGTALLVTF
ncbi:metal transporter [Waterburya agarophytonicola K14]|uniref:Metal transporter n=1 Tax=Waterburya agarophytonicola KI4 TaxID=2874699 RepID=A0A964BPR9_9CYAN|nr:metal transporter [Waterburya agarophytonicola]MCC0175906.1 metal transporter [Waterburya agarophytonicola KI4]